MLTPRSSEARWTAPLALRCALSVSILFFVMLFCTPHLLEDGFIYARYLRNALGGLGLVFNVGEHVNALTSPLYSYVLLALSWAMHGQILLAERILFVVFLCGTCCLAETLVAWSSMLLCTCVYFYGLIGMETTMFLFFILLTILLLEKERYDWLPIVLVLLALSRMEGAAMTPVVAWICYRRNRWPRWVAFLPAFAVIAVYLAANHHLYGSMMPASSSAKIGQGKSGFWGKWPRAFLYGYRLDPIGRPAFWAFIPQMLAIPLALRRLRGTTWNAAAVPFFIILFSFYVLLNIPNYGWYYAPLILLVSMTATAEFTATRAGAVLLAVLVVAQGVSAIRMLCAVRGDRETPYSAAAAWLNVNAPKDATVESLEIGEFGWLLDRYLYDSLGLTLPKNADHIAHRDFDSWLEEDKPDYVLYHTTRPFPFERIIVRDPNYAPLDYNRLDIVIYKRIHDIGPRGSEMLPKSSLRAK